MSKPEKIQRLRAQRDRARAQRDRWERHARVRGRAVADLSRTQSALQQRVAELQQRLSDLRGYNLSLRETVTRQVRETGETVQRLVDESDNAQAEVERLSEVERAADQCAADQARIIASLRSQTNLVGEAVAVNLPDPAVPTEETREQAMSEAAAALGAGFAQAMDLALVQGVADERLAIMQDQTGTIKRLERDLELSQGTVTAYETASKAWERRALEAEKVAAHRGATITTLTSERDGLYAQRNEQRNRADDAEERLAAEGRTGAPTETDGPWLPYGRRLEAALREAGLVEDRDGAPYVNAHLDHVLAPASEAHRVDYDAVRKALTGATQELAASQAAVLQWQERADQAVQETVEAERLHREVAQHLEAAMRRYTHAEGQRDEQSAIADRAAQAADRYATQLAEAEARRAREDQQPGIMAEPVTPSDAALLALASMGATVAEIAADVASRVADAGRILFR